MSIRHRGNFVFKRDIPASSSIDILFPHVVTTVDIFAGSTNIEVTFHSKDMLDNNAIPIKANAFYSVDNDSTGIMIANTDAVNACTVYVVGWLSDEV
jgi:hypothetical protein